MFPDHWHFTGVFNLKTDEFLFFFFLIFSGESLEKYQFFYLFFLATVPLQFFTSMNET